MVIFVKGVLLITAGGHEYWDCFKPSKKKKKKDNGCQISHDAISDLISRHDRWHQARISHFDKLISKTVKILRGKKTRNMNIADGFSGLVVLHKAMNKFAKMTALAICVILSDQCSHLHTTIFTSE